jgi:hypothetical protein
MDRYTWVDWDDDDDPEGNVQHIAQNGLTKDEVESVLLNPKANVDSSRSSGLPIVFGETFTGRFIAVVFDELCDDPEIVRPITAYEPDDDL